MNSIDLKDISIKTSSLNNKDFGKIETKNIKVSSPSIQLGKLDVSEVSQNTIDFFPDKMNTKLVNNGLKISTTISPDLLAVSLKKEEATKSNIIKNYNYSNLIDDWKNKKLDIESKVLLVTNLTLSLGTLEANSDISDFYFKAKDWGENTFGKNGTLTTAFDELDISHIFNFDDKRKFKERLEDVREFIHRANIAFEKIKDDMEKFKSDIMGIQLTRDIDKAQNYGAVYSLGFENHYKDQEKSMFYQLNKPDAMSNMFDVFFFESIGKDGRTTSVLKHPATFLSNFANANLYRLLSSRVESINIPGIQMSSFSQKFCNTITERKNNNFQDPHQATFTIRADETLEVIRMMNSIAGTDNTFARDPNKEKTLSFNHSLPDINNPTFVNNKIDKAAQSINIGEGNSGNFTKQKLINTNATPLYKYFKKNEALHKNKNVTLDIMVMLRPTHSKLDGLYRVTLNSLSDNPNYLLTLHTDKNVFIKEKENYIKQKEKLEEKNQKISEERKKLSDIWQKENNEFLDNLTGKLTSIKSQIENVKDSTEKLEKEREELEALEKLTLTQKLSLSWNIYKRKTLEEKKTKLLEKETKVHDSYFEIYDKRVEEVSDLLDKFDKSSSNYTQLISNFERVISNLDSIITTFSRIKYYIPIYFTFKDVRILGSGDAIHFKREGANTQTFSFDFIYKSLEISNNETVFAIMENNIINRN